MALNINNFGPFDVSVWGTVGDWVMIFATAITAYYLWKTLKSQHLVQKLQEQVTRFEAMRFENDFMPKFTLTAENENPTYLLLTFQTNDKLHSHFDYAVAGDWGNEVKDVSRLVSASTYPRTVLNYQAPFRLSFICDNLSVNVNLMTLVIRFKNILDEEYQMAFVIRREFDGNMLVSPSSAIRIRKEMLEKNYPWRGATNTIFDSTIKKEIS